MVLGLYIQIHFAIMSIRQQLYIHFFKLILQVQDRQLEEIIIILRPELHEISEFIICRKI